MEATEGGCGSGQEIDNDEVLIENDIVRVEVQPMDKEAEVPLLFYKWKKLIDCDIPVPNSEK